ncbi:MAG: Imm1 family immunity protein [Solirubrobacteraceae bacterium]|nr:Imm1 family immunity protein [Solirubrobacteraceae bacterium]
MAVVEWGDEQREEVRTAAELDALLERLATEARAEGRPQDVQLTVEGAGTLGMVVGDDRSVLNHVPDNLDPPYMVSVGSEVSDEPFVFYVAGDNYSEALHRNTILPPAARAAMRHFLATGALSPEVEWEQI